MIPYLAVVYIAADIGAIGAGSLSSLLMKRGSSLNVARKATMVLLAAIMMPSVVIASQTEQVWPSMLLIALACGCHQAWATMLFTVTADLFPRQGAASVTGIGGCVAGFASIITAELTGQVLNRDPRFYVPMFLSAAALYPISLFVLHRLSPRLEPADVGDARRDLAVEPWRSAITDTGGEDVRIRGEELGALMREATFSDVVGLLLNGRRPDAGERRLIDAILIAIADHGAGAPPLLPLASWPQVIARSRGGDRRRNSRDR